MSRYEHKHFAFIVLSRDNICASNKLGFKKTFFITKKIWKLYIWCLHFCVLLCIVYKYKNCLELICISSVLNNFRLTIIKSLEPFKVRTWGPGENIASTKKFQATFSPGFVRLKPSLELSSHITKKSHLGSEKWSYFLPTQVSFTYQVN